MDKMSCFIDLKIYNVKGLFTNQNFKLIFFVCVFKAKGLSTIFTHMKKYLARLINRKGNLKFKTLNLDNKY